MSTASAAPRTAAAGRPCRGGPARRQAAQGWGRRRWSSGRSAVAAALAAPRTAAAGRPCRAGPARRQAAQGWGRQRGSSGRSAVAAAAEPEGLRVPVPKKPSLLGPSFWLSREEAVLAQLKALQDNNLPHHDHGVEVLYRFAGFDPFARSRYFGVSLDLGQFERFRRILYTPCFVTLVNHSEHHILSELEVSETEWLARVRVTNAYRKEEQVYTFNLEQRFGGRFDGYWYTSSLVCDGCSGRSLYGVI